MSKLRKKSTVVLERQLKSKRMDLMKLRKSHPLMRSDETRNYLKCQVVSLRGNISDIQKKYRKEQKIENRYFKKLSISIQQYGLFG